MHLAQIYRKIAHYIDIDAPTPNADRSGLALVAVLKNQANYLQEWIKYHAVIGVKSIYLYDIDSDDDTMNIAINTAENLNIHLEILPWLFDNISLRRSFTTLDEHVMAYCHAFCTHGAKYRWMTPMTTDEFIVLKENENINDFLASVDKFTNVSLFKRYYHYQQDTSVIFNNINTHNIVKKYYAFNFLVDPCNVTQVGVKRISTNDMERNSANELGKVEVINQRNSAEYVSHQKIQINKYLTYLHIQDKVKLKQQFNALKLNWFENYKLRILNKKIIPNPIQEDAIINYLSKRGINNKSDLLNY